MARKDKVGFWYRVRWNVQYALLSVAGPAHLDESQDPRTRMRAERAARERRAAEGEDR
ncbi:hypothetical protein [Aquipuribacter sp. MA13-6]|uniref:hypothetical protein n=1 Tax=unclassified Aquipuribacter TaxID=2635084 RepID=UPI003EE94335